MSQKYSVSVHLVIHVTSTIHGCGGKTEASPHTPAISFPRLPSVSLSCDLHPYQTTASST